MIRKRKLFVRPRKMYVKTRILEENALLVKYGLKNKKEVWKTIAKIDYFRNRAKSLAGAGPDEQNVLFDKLKKIGLKTESISDVLALKIESLLERRLPTVVFKKGLAKTPKEARQMVVHKRIFIDGKAINIPGYIVSVEEESKIKVKPLKNKSKEKTVKEGEKLNE